MPTTQISDIGFIRDRSIVIVELTVPFELNLTSSHDKKNVDRYSSLVRYIKDKTYQVYFYAIEIGSRGDVDKDNAGRIKKITVLLVTNSTGLKYETICQN